MDSVALFAQYLMGNLESEVDRFMRKVMCKLSENKYSLAMDTFYDDFMVLVYNSYSTEDSQDLGEFILFPGILYPRNRKNGKEVKVRMNRPLHNKKDNVDIFTTINSLVRILNKYHPSSSFDVDLHCQISVVKLNQLTGKFVVIEMPHDELLVCSPVYRKTISSY
jgi:hypothetical protein